MSEKQLFISSQAGRKVLVTRKKREEKITGIRASKMVSASDKSLKGRKAAL